MKNEAYIYIYIYIYIYYTPTKYNIISHDWKYINNQLFLADFEKINWNQVLQLNQNINF